MESKSQDPQLTGRHDGVSLSPNLSPRARETECPSSNIFGQQEWTLPYSAFCSTQAFSGLDQAPHLPSQSSNSNAHVIQKHHYTHPEIVFNLGSLWFTQVAHEIHHQQSFICNVCYDHSKITVLFRYSSFSCSVVSNSATPWTAACLSITNSESSLKLMSIESMMPSNHLIHGIPFPSCLQSFPAPGSFAMSHFFTSDGQSIGASASVLPMNIQD